MCNEEKRRSSAILTVNCSYFDGNCLRNREVREISGKLLNISEILCYHVYLKDQINLGFSGIILQDNLGLFVNHQCNTGSTIMQPDRPEAAASIPTVDRSVLYSLPSC